MHSAARHPKHPEGRDDERPRCASMTRRSTHDLKRRHHERFLPVIANAVKRSSGDHSSRAAMPGPAWIAASLRSSQ